MPSSNDIMRKMKVAVVGGGNGGEPASEPAAQSLPPRPRWGRRTVTGRGALHQWSSMQGSLPCPPFPLPPAAKAAAAMAGYSAAKVDLFFSPKYADRAAVLAAAIKRNGGLILHSK